MKKIQKIEKKWLFCIQVLCFFIVTSSLQDENAAERDERIYSGTFSSYKSVPDWENPAVLGRNKEDAHWSFYSYADRETAMDNNPRLSPYFLSLDGMWKFYWVRKPSERPVEFFRPDYQADSRDDIEAPGNGALQVYGVPVYTDTEYPFPADPPRIPHDCNPVGSYRRDFILRKDLYRANIFDGE